VPFICDARANDCEIVIPYTCKECANIYPCKGEDCNHDPKPPSPKPKPNPKKPNCEHGNCPGICHGPKCHFVVKPHHTPDDPVVKCKNK